MAINAPLYNEESFAMPNGPHAYVSLATPTWQKIRAPTIVVQCEGKKDGEAKCPSPVWHSF